MRYTLTVYNKGIFIDKYHFDTPEAVDEFVKSNHKLASDGPDLELFEHSTGFYWISYGDNDIDGSVIWYPII